NSSVVKAKTVAAEGNRSQDGAGAGSKCGDRAEVEVKRRFLVASGWKPGVQRCTEKHYGRNDAKHARSRRQQRRAQAADDFAARRLDWSPRGIGRCDHG